MKFSFVVISPVSLLFLGIVYSQPQNPQPVSSPSPRRKDAGRQSRTFHSNHDFFSCIVCEVATITHNESRIDSHASYRFLPNGFLGNKSLLKEHLENGSLYALQCNVSHSSKVCIRCEKGYSSSSNIKCKDMLYYKFPSTEHGYLCKANDSDHLYLKCDDGYELLKNNSLVVCTEEAFSAEIVCKAMRFELRISLIIAVVSSLLVLIILMAIVAICVQRIKRTEDQVPTWRKKMEEREKYSSNVEEKVYKDLIEAPRRSFRFPFYLPKGKPTGKMPMPLQEDGQLILNQSSEKDGTAIIREGIENNSFEMEVVVSQHVGRRGKRGTLQQKVIGELQQKLAMYSFDFNSRAASRKETIRYPGEECGQKKNQKTRDRLTLKCMMKKKKHEEFQEVSSDRHNVHGPASGTQTLTPRSESSMCQQSTHSLGRNNKRVCESSLSSENSQFKPKSSIPIESPKESTNLNGSHSEKDRVFCTTMSENKDCMEDPYYLQLSDILVHKETANFQNSHLTNESSISSTNGSVLKSTMGQQKYEEEFLEGPLNHHNVCASTSHTQMPPIYEESSRDLRNVRSPEGEKKKLCQSSHNSRKKQLKPKYSMPIESPKQSRNIKDNHCDKDSHPSVSESIDTPEDPYYLQLADIVVHRESADNEM